MYYGIRGVTLQRRNGENQANLGIIADSIGTFLFVSEMDAAKEFVAAITKILMMPPDVEFDLVLYNLIDKALDVLPAWHGREKYGAVYDLVDYVNTHYK